MCTHILNRIVPAPRPGTGYGMLAIVVINATTTPGPMAKSIHRDTERSVLFDLSRIHIPQLSHGQNRTQNIPAQRQRPRTYQHRSSEDVRSCNKIGAKSSSSSEEIASPDNKLASNAKAVCPLRSSRREI
ncbi:hypothetical protein EVAR_29848_1 [Eumeta japonica]|uniref:Uncharacterized protein n=1 Tax=Eumeta variegata TaxID=151549 RepID=A0A4C1VUP6_EUMVA|nr:hypothetical protein EVAR_29848_1 [Eumeta japonica]